MKNRALTVLFALLVALFGAVATNAQENPFCFGLAAEDCALIGEVTNATAAALQSATLDYTIDVSITGIPESAGLGSSEITFNLIASGPVVIGGDSMLPITLANTMQVKAAGGPAPIDGTTEVRVVDGILYFDMGGQWASIDLAEATSMEIPGLGSLDGALGGEAPADPAAAEAMAQAQGALMGVMGALPQLLQVPGFLSYTRDGAAFTFNADLAALFASPEFSTTLESLSTSLGEDGAQIAAMGPMLGALVQSGTITVVQKIDEGSKLLTGLDFMVDTTIALGADPLAVKIAFSVAVSGVNETYEIVAPEGAQAIPLGAMMGGQ